MLSSGSERPGSRQRSKSSDTGDSRGEFLLNNMSSIDQNVWVTDAHAGYIIAPPVASFGD
jgi:hypothetical protein